MHLLHSTATLPPANRFKVWRDLLADRYGEFEFTRLGDRPFTSKVEATKIGSLPIARFTQSAAEQTSRRRPSSHAPDSVLALFKLAGTTSGTMQEDRAAVQRPGDLDLAPWSALILKLESVDQETDDEEEPVQRRAD
ncbi:hypothetical protein ABIC70_005344, partial [Methylobacterium sp. 1973]